MAFLSIVGAVAGAMLSWRFISPGLAGESTWFQRFAIGAPAAVAAVLLSAPAWTDSPHPRNEGNLMMASFIGLLVLDWKKRLSPNRSDRLSLGLAVTSAITALILCGMLNLDPDRGQVVFATIIGARRWRPVYARAEESAAFGGDGCEVGRDTVSGCRAGAGIICNAADAANSTGKATALRPSCWQRARSVAPAVTPSPATPFDAAFAKNRKKKHNNAWLFLWIIAALFFLRMLQPSPVQAAYRCARTRVGKSRSCRSPSS